MFAMLCLSTAQGMLLCFRWIPFGITLVTRAAEPALGFRVPKARSFSSRVFRFGFNRAKAPFGFLLFRVPRFPRISLCTHAHRSASGDSVNRAATECLSEEASTQIHCMVLDDGSWKDLSRLLNVNGVLELLGVGCYAVVCRVRGWLPLWTRGGD